MNVAHQQQNSRKDENNEIGVCRYAVDDVRTGMEPRNVVNQVFDIVFGGRLVAQPFFDALLNIGDDGISEPPECPQSIPGQQYQERKRIMGRPRFPYHPSKKEEDDYAQVKGMKQVIQEK